MPSRITTTASSANGKSARSRSDSSPAPPAWRRGVDAPRGHHALMVAGAASRASRAAPRARRPAPAPRPRASSRNPCVRVRRRRPPGPRVAAPLRIASVTARRPDTMVPPPGGRCGRRRSRSRLTSARRSARQPAPSPLRPEPLRPRRLHRHAFDRRRRAPPRGAARISARRGAIGGPIADDREVARRHGANPASRTSATVRASRSSAGDALDRRIASPGSARRGRRAPAAPSSASAIAWHTTSPSEWPARPSSPSNRTPPSQSGRPSARGCTSKPSPTRRASSGIGTADARLGACEVEERGDLEVLRIARDGHAPCRRPAPTARRRR